MKMLDTSPEKLLSGTLGCPTGAGRVNKFTDASRGPNYLRPSSNSVFFIGNIALVQNAIDDGVVLDMGDKKIGNFQFWLKFGETTFWLPRATGGISVYLYNEVRDVFIERIG